MRQSFLRLQGKQHNCAYPIASNEYNEMLEKAVKELAGFAEITIETALKEQFAPKEEKEIEHIFMGHQNGVLAIEIIVHFQGSDKPTIFMAFAGNETIPDEL